VIFWVEGSDVRHYNSNVDGRENVRGFDAASGVSRQKDAPEHV